MDALFLKYEVLCDSWAAEFKTPGFISGFSPPSLQKPPPFGHHRLPEFCRHMKRMGLLRRKIGRFLNCCKDWEAKQPTVSVELRRGSATGCGFYSRTSAVDRDERIREAVLYCKRTMTSSSL